MTNEKSNGKKILVIHSRQNLKNVRKFQKLLAAELPEEFKCDLVTDVRPEIDAESFSFAKVPDNTLQIEKLESVREQHDKYISMLMKYDFVIIYLPVDMRSMFEIGFCYAMRTTTILFFSDEPIKYNVMYLPSNFLYGQSCEIDDITRMVKEMFAPNGKDNKKDEKETAVDVPTESEDKDKKSATKKK